MVQLHLRKHVRHVAWEIVRTILEDGTYLHNCTHASCGDVKLNPLLLESRLKLHARGCCLFK